MILNIQGERGSLRIQSWRIMNMELGLLG